MKKVFTVKTLDNYMLRKAEIISRKTIDPSELDKMYPERIEFKAADEDGVLVLSVGDVVIVPYTCAGDEPLYSAYTFLQ